MKKPCAAVFFDMGSTLSCQDPLREDLIADFLAARGYPRPVQDVRRALLSADNWWHEWAQEAPFAWREEANRDTLRQRYRDAFLGALDLVSSDGLRQALSDVWSASIMRRHNAVYADVMPTLQALRAGGLRLAIVSNWDESLQSHCDDLQLTPFFETIVGSLAVGYEKPDPRIFHVALARLALAPDQVIHVGDLYPSDVIGARRAGITPVLIDRFDLQPQVDCLRVRSLQELLTLVLSSRQD